jgi:hypothetical protein
MITFGGWAGGSPRSGGSRYDAAANSVTPISYTGAPKARARHSAIWTGERMIIWGGIATASTSTGGAFCAVPACTVTAWYRDHDADGFGNVSDMIRACVQPAGYVAAGGDCNDESGAALPGAAELCDGLDNDCNTLIDDVAIPGAVDLLRVSKQEATVDLTWPAAAGATSYDVVKGSLVTLRLSGGDFTTATTSCLADDTAATTATDSDPLGPGEGVWHLVRAANCGGAGTYDSGAPQQSGSRNAEIAASASACP